MFTDEDSRRLLESRHDIGACEDPAVLTPNKPMQHAASASRSELAAAREVLRVAAATVDREHNETDAERLKLSQALTTAIRRYGFVRSKVQDALLNVDPDEAPEATEIERRQRLFGRVFGAASSDLDRMGQGALLERLSHVVSALHDDLDLAPLKHAKSLGSACTAAQEAARSLSRETGEDADAMKTLRAAREGFDRSASAHSLLIESILVRQGRGAELGRFVLAYDPAYAARRAARVPVVEEPGSDDLAAPSPEIPTTGG